MARQGNKKAAFYIAMAIIILLLIIKPDMIINILSKTIHLLSPIFIGMTIAFVMNRPIYRLEKTYRSMSKSASSRLVTNLAVFTGYILLIGILTGIIFIIVPQIFKSITLLVGSVDVYYDNFMRHYKVLERKDNLGILKAITDFLNTLTDKIPIYVEKAYAKTFDIISGIINFVIGFVISIYILVDKDRIKKASSEIFRAFTTASGFERSKRYYRLIFDTFSRFVSGQIIEGIILGILCFLGMKLFRFEYALLISSLIGITALIPVVGAFIGTIPAAFLLFLADPMKAVWFIVFIVILQQLENNLIYPKVVGKSLGLPSLLVLIAILIGAGVGGVSGILLGVPLASVMYAVICDYVNVKNGKDKCEIWQRGDEVI